MPEGPTACVISGALEDGAPYEEWLRQLFDGLGGFLSSQILLQDLRYAVRTLRRDRVFACIAVLILTLGIGVNIVGFGVVNTILLRPLRFRDSSQLAWLAENHGMGGLSATFAGMILLWSGFDRRDTFQRAEPHASTR